MSDGAGSETRVSDGFGRVANVMRPGHSRVDYTWMDTDLPESASVQGGDTTTWTPDGDGLISGVTSGTRTTAYDYDLAGNAVRTVHPALAGGEPVVEARTFNAQDELETLDRVRGAESLSQVEITRDAVGRAQIDRSEGETERFAYDAAGRLSRECTAEPCDGPAGEWTRYAYDASGNRTHASRQDGSERVFSYDEDDRLTSRQNGADPAVSMSYNVRGELQDDGDHRFWYDQAGMVVGTVASERGVFDDARHRGAGMRIATTDSAGSTRLVWDTSPAPSRRWSPSSTARPATPSVAMHTVQEG